MISQSMTIVAILNSMIGGTILVLPILFMTAGVFPSIISIIIMGLVNYISCKFCIDHLANDNDIPDTLNRHSNGGLVFGNIYNIFVFCGNIIVCIMYFYLICIQLELIFNSLSKWIPVGNAIVLLILIMTLKKFEFGTQLLGYGIISIISYIFFLLWVLISKPSINSQKNIPIWTWNFNEVFNALSTAFSIQGVFIPIIRKCRNQQSNNKIILLSYIFGGAAYSYIGFAGSYGIINRTPYIRNPQTIQQYFSNEDWPVIIIAVVYLIHLYTALPEYLSIGISRFLSLCNIKSSQNKYKWQQIIFIIMTLSLCIIVTTFDIKLSTILAINGSIIGFFMTYLVPVYINIQCYYFYNSKPINKFVEMNIATVEQIDLATCQNKNNITSQQDKNQNKSYIKSNIQILQQFSYCNKTDDSCKRQSIMCANLFLLTFGLFVLIYTLYTLGSS